MDVWSTREANRWSHFSPNVSQPPFRVFPLPAHPVLHRPMRAWTGNPAFWLPVAARCSRTSRQPGRLSDGHQLASSSSSGSGRSEVSRCLRGGHASRQVKSQRSPAASAVKSNQIKPRLLADDGGKVERLAVTNTESGRDGVDGVDGEVVDRLAVNSPTPSFTIIDSRLPENRKVDQRHCSSNSVLKITLVFCTSFLLGMIIAIIYMEAHLWGD